LKLKKKDLNKQFEHYSIKMKLERLEAILPLYKSATNEELNDSKTKSERLEQSKERKRTKDIQRAS
jgi:hypothetical protein